MWHSAARMDSWELHALLRRLRSIYVRCCLAVPLSPAHTDGFFGFGRARDRDFRHFGLCGATNVQLLADLGIHFCKDVPVFLQKAAGIFTALANAFAGVGVPRTGLLDDVVSHSQIEHVALATNSLAVEDVEFRLAERSCHLV